MSHIMFKLVKFSNKNTIQPRAKNILNIVISYVYFLSLKPKCVVFVIYLDFSLYSYVTQHMHMFYNT